MNGTNVSNAILEAAGSGELPDLTPEARKAATYVLENPRDVGVSTVREIAQAANVKPNTVVRMARQVGFEGYEDFRAPFPRCHRRGAADFPDRARWLQDIRKSGDLGGLYADMVKRRAAQHRRDICRNLHRRPESRRRGDLGCAAGLYAGGRCKQFCRAEFHLPRLDRHDGIPRDPAAGVNPG